MLEEKQVLLIDDNESRRHDLQTILKFLGESVLLADKSNWQAVVEANKREKSEIAAVVLGEINASLRQELDRIRQWDVACPVILLGSEHVVEDEWDPYLKKSVVFRFSALPTYTKMLDALHCAQRYREAINTQRGNHQRPVHLFRSLVGTSTKVSGIRAMMAQVADKEVTVLITGESGTGKEVVARNLHRNSKRSKGPFVPVNCGAIPAELLESELFGHEKGAFTGAISSRAGRFELAEGGTLFLDEIGDMPLSMQVKILRVLQEKTYERVGGSKSLTTDVRIIAATHRNLEEMITEGSFREDLYYRLNVFPIEMPSLRERTEDIPLLINELVSRLENEKRGTIRFNSSAILSLCRHEWSGNVREMANLVERMAIMHPHGVVGVNDLPVKYRHADPGDEELDELPATEPVNGTGYQPLVASMNDRALLPEEGIDLKEYLTGLERNLIQQALADNGGVVARAADHLAIRRTTLVEKMRKYGLQR